MYGQNRGLSGEDKEELIQFLSKRMKVFISSELPLSAALEKYRLPSPPDKIHSILAFASIFIGESLTMASEAALLGTPSLCVSTAGAGTLDDQKKRGLVLHFDNVKELIGKCDEILTDPVYRSDFRKLSEKYFSESVNVTDFLVWFVENYPESKLKIQKEPDYQFSFK
jgi:hypothetical protein